jgi:hypothetical protein
MYCYMYMYILYILNILHIYIHDKCYKHIHIYTCDECYKRIHIYIYDKYYKRVQRSDESLVLWVACTRQVLLCILLYLVYHYKLEL